MTVRRWLSAYAIFVALAIACLVLAIGTDTFFTAENLANVLRQNAVPAVIAAGMTLVILTGGIDLSVGSVVALSGVLCVDALVHGWPLPLAVAAGVAMGVAVGLVNGLVVTRIRVPPFIVTLAMMLVVRGIALKYTDARTVYGPPPSFATLSFGLSMIAVMVIVFAATWLLLMRTPFGRHVFAVGGNRDAAWLSGVRVDRVLVTVYVLCGLGAGIAGVLVASRLNSGYPRAGELYELDAVAAVVVGGTSLFGGRGSIWCTLAGAFFIGILGNGLNLYNVSPYDQMVVKGAVLLIAASLDRWRHS
jgi:ribose transport system permease protein